MRILIVTLLVLAFFGCRKKGCTDSNALNQVVGVYPEENGNTTLYISGPYNGGGYDDEGTTYFKEIPGVEVDYIISGHLRIEKDVVIDPGVKFLVETGSKIFFMEMYMH